MGCWDEADYSWDAHFGQTICTYVHTHTHTHTHTHSHAHTHTHTRRRILGEKNIEKKKQLDEAT